MFIHYVYLASYNVWTITRKSIYREISIVDTDLFWISRSLPLCLLVTLEPKRLYQKKIVRKFILKKKIFMESH